MANIPVQFSRVQLFATPWIAARQASLSITNSRSSLRLTSIESVMPSSHLILCHALLLLPPIPPRIRVFSNESALRMRWPKYWSFSLSIIPKKSQGWSPSNGLVGKTCSPRTSQESSPTPQVKSINSSGLSFLYSLNLTSIHRDIPFPSKELRFRELLYVWVNIPCGGTVPAGPKHRVHHCV